MTQLDNYTYGGARSMVILHERRQQEFLTTWKRARTLGIVLPKVNDPDYESMETLLLHVLRAGAGYLNWICERLNLPNPGIEEAPHTDEIEVKADAYLSHLLDRWRLPLRDVAEESFYRPEYTSRWKTLYCIDAMMEHAVMHPSRHSLQLEEFIGDR